MHTGPLNTQQELVLIACRNGHQWLSPRDYVSNPGGWVPSAPECSTCGCIYLYEVKQPEFSKEQLLFSEVLQELKRARLLHPAPNAHMGALVEEIGEVSKALMYEPWTGVRQEAVQAIAMLVRLVLEGDCTFVDWRRLWVSAGDDMPAQPANSLLCTICHSRLSSAECDCGVKLCTTCEPAHTSCEV